MSRNRLHGIVLVVALVGGSVAVPVQVQAAVPIPTPKVTLPAAVDRAAFYEPQTVCDPTPRPGVVALRDLLLATYGSATMHIGRACTSSTSEHFDGRALDWMRDSRVPAQKAQADAFVAWLLAEGPDGTPQAMARRLGIMYVIWNNRMIRMYDPGRGWTNYNGCLAKSKSRKALDTSCHRNHVHLSLSWDGAARQTSFWTGVAQTLASCPRRGTTAKPRAGTARVIQPATFTGLTTVPATRILDTAGGVGAGLAEGCRLRAGRSLYPSVPVGAAVPSHARWAAVRISSSSNAPARLSVWSSGAARPAGQVSSPIGTTAATLLVPIALDGTIALATSQGSARLSAWLVGYIAAGSTEDGTRKAATRPSVPRKVKAKSSRGTVTTRWKKPRSTGGAAITGYRVEALVSKRKGAAVAGWCTTAGTARRCTISGLTKGKRYWMSVSVGNSVGRTWAKRVKVRVR